jgi:uncharacterized membrane protein HdeD (DUF308 family)
MKIQKILASVAIGIIILGLGLIFIQSEIQVTLLGTFLLIVGILIGIIQFVAKGQPN